ncbi:hypothetical protein DL240_08965 [Lujinxingia litoralis]|uniref:YchJ-like middle NTF2-like domain-containing protein n=1 Tax=Lujinxingia litoralis TaxID=2211119 RepID=A0A328C672_9DELT|nr:YchJ family metal-binding protein [Lujinxingia litoralis]RAL23009.1 hypothetical protein DL240_08965 [Lujinxingia litoralis]
MRRRTCPCSSNQPAALCCGKYHRGLPAPNPEALMRSRFSAYARGLVDYVIDTTLPESPQAKPERASWRRELLAYCKATDFVELRVLHTEWEPGQSEGFVTFKATLIQDRQPFSFTERSRFELKTLPGQKGDPRWYYAEGEELEEGV